VGKYQVAYNSSINMHYMRNRWYTPQIGRFITKDPLMELTIPMSNLIKVPISLTFYVFGFNYPISSPNSLHRYTYAEANPINLIDPYGLQAFFSIYPSFLEIFEDGGGVKRDGKGGNKGCDCSKSYWNCFLDMYIMAKQHVWTHVFAF
jgi:hypothetical protein